MRQVMTIAGSDSGAGAGIQADLKTFAALGVYGLSAITSLTAQNTRGVTHVHEAPVESVRAQIRALFDDFDVAAVKTGMLPTEAIIDCVAEELERAGPRPLVVDPVMVSTTRAELMRGDALPALRDRLVPLATVVTPNRFEASALIGRDLRGAEDLRAAAAEIARLARGWAVLKGGDLEEEEESTDFLSDGTETVALSAPRIRTRGTHGTGCTFASALAARLALGDDVPAAARRAKAYVTGAIRGGPDIGGGRGPVDHFWFQRPWSPED
ncbi:MAG: bifunctional hydroxymethylpyrimidine kinase/phosphomethylpyrimidine kinase [Candidatus Eisenbacteria bacterium]|nr:bifunctional hydroxymethylpyrimidine kinase/phosphomethylpyrimidine kinase [Candidatus Eisenbacteria bacterium]